MEGTTDVTPSFWQLVQGDNRDLFKIGYNSDREPIELYILDEVLFLEWTNGSGLTVADDLRQKLNLKGRVYAPGRDIIDTKFIQAVIDAFVEHRQEHREIKYREITFQQTTAPKGDRS